MAQYDEIGIRMKQYYENIPKTQLMRRCPAIIRIDGKAFHTLTKGFARPFDDVFAAAMWETAQYLCANIQGCVLGYTQSDEISLLLVDYKNLESQAWFDYEVQKMCSIAASMATMAFNKAFMAKAIAMEGSLPAGQFAVYEKQFGNAMFDARAFNIPKEEVANYFYWRQLDASRNSIQSVGQAYFSQKELHKKSQSDIQDMLMLQKRINWNDLPIWQKRGVCVKKEQYVMSGGKERKTITPVNGQSSIVRSRWVVDMDIPIFKGDGRDYIESLVFIGE